MAKETTLSSIKISISDIPITDSVANLTPVLNAISNLNNITAAQIVTALQLVAEDFKADIDANAIAQAVETAILNETDGQRVIDAIVNAIDNKNVTAEAIAQLVNDKLKPNLTIINENVHSSSLLIPTDKPLL